MDVLGLDELLTGSYWQLGAVIAVLLVCVIIKVITDLRTNFQQITNNDLRNIKTDTLATYTNINNQRILELIRDASIRSNKNSTTLHEELQKDIDLLNSTKNYNNLNNANDFGNVPSS